MPVVDGTAEGLYKLLTDFFNKHAIPYKSNLIGFAADGTNTMMGPKHSLQTMLKADVPNIFIMKCVCHSLALCDSYACEKLPESVEDLVKSIYTYFQYSPKRQHEFQAFQKFAEVKIHKLLRPCQTRWLSLLACVERIVEQYPALLLYFQGEFFIDDNAKSIYKKLKPINKLYLLFLEHVLPILTCLLYTSRCV